MATLEFAITTPEGAIRHSADLADAAADRIVAAYQYFLDRDKVDAEGKLTAVPATPQEAVKAAGLRMCAVMFAEVQAIEQDRAVRAAGAPISFT